MADNEDCGCNTIETPDKIPHEDVDIIKEKMTDTKDTLEKMLSSVEGLNFDMSKFDNLENEIKRVSEFMYSGEFVKSFENLIQGGQNGLDNPIFKDYFNKKQNLMGDYFGHLTPEQKEILEKVTNTTPPKKTPVGYVYLDENGDQKFSPTEPEGIVSSPVYGA